MYFNLNLYGSLDESEKNDIRYADIKDNLLNNRIAFIKYENLPKTIKGSMIEYLLASFGIAVIGKNKKGELKVGYPLEMKTSTIDSMPFDSNGMPKVKKGITIDGEELKDCYVLRNNYLLRSNYKFITRLANQLTKVCMSESKLVEKSICNPIPVARNEQAYNGIKTVMKKIDESIDVIKIEDNDSWNENGLNDYDMIDFTNISYADKFKYLTTYYNDLFARFFETFGFPLNAPTKQAQTNSDELLNKVESASCYINGMIEVRLEDWETINIELGLDVRPYFVKDDFKSDDVTENVSRETSSEESETLEDDEESESDDNDNSTRNVE